MGFLLYDIIFLVLFGLFLVTFLYKKRKNLKREGILYLYKTKLGIKIIDYIGGKYEKTLKILSYFVILVGYILMVTMLYFLGQLLYFFLKFPAVVKIIKIPPIMPLIPYLPSIFKIEFLPPFYFTYWIIAIAIIAISHEFSHGIFARLNKVKIKSTGFGFLGPFLAAFVEPDEKQMNKKSIFSQLSVLSAGSFANVLMTILFFIILYLFFILAFTQAGATFDTYVTTTVNITGITSIGGYAINNANPAKILDLIEQNEIKDDLTMGLDEEINLTEINVGEEMYFLDLKNLKNQLEMEQGLLLVYGDFPAIKEGLKGTIIEINEAGIKNNKELKEEMAKYGPGEIITVKTKFGDEFFSYNLELAKSPLDENQAFMGIASLETRRSGLFGILYKLFNFFREPATEYSPKFDGDLTIFIYNLLWWIIIINISVALVNMLPVGLFDGGRVFYLTALAITKKEKIAKKLFVVMTYVILLIFLLLMISWLLPWLK
jgi:membrane-associated protease RseP (regulator of RpoE activity)